MGNSSVVKDHLGNELCTGDVVKAWWRGVSFRARISDIQVFTLSQVTMLALTRLDNGRVEIRFSDSVVKISDGKMNL